MCKKSNSIQRIKLTLDDISPFGFEDFYEDTLPLIITTVLERALNLKTVCIVKAVSDGKYDINLTIGNNLSVSFRLLAWRNNDRIASTIAEALQDYI